MDKRERFNKVLDYFSTHQPSPDTELIYADPYQLLVSVILSAQCTDKRVNMITPELFARFPDAWSLSQGTSPEIHALIKSCSYPNNKTKHLQGMARVLFHDFNGVVPSSPEDLQKLPGVGRKTANVIASVIYNKPTLAVDTHVFRVSARLGLTTNAKNPLQAEQQLTRHIPQKQIPLAHHWLILHGRYICTARNPKCQTCPINRYCKYYESSMENG